MTEIAFMSNRPLSLIEAIKWSTSWPVRKVLQYAPIPRGRGRILRLFVVPTLPGEDASFRAPLPLGGSIQLRYREALATAIFASGSFEQAESLYLSKCLYSDAVAIDVGANIGYFSIQFAKALSDQGSVWAIEPLPANLSRLRENLRESLIHSVEIIPAAASASDGPVHFQESADSAMGHVLTELPATADSEFALSVPGRSLDSLWHERDTPRVSLIKIDVEGSGLSVLRGAEQLLFEERPTLMIEAGGMQELIEIDRFLEPVGYHRLTPPEFRPWNHIFRAIPSKISEAEATRICT